MPRSPSSSPTRWRPTSMGRGTSARPAARATSTTSCSSSGPTGRVLRRRHEGAARLRRRHQDAGEHDRRQQGLDPRQQRARCRVAVGRLAAGQGGDDLFLAADAAAWRRTIRRATRRSTSSRTPRSPARSAMPWCRRQSGACDRLQQGARGRFAPIRRPPTCSCNGRPRRRCRWPASCCPMRCAIPTGCRTSSRSSTGALWPDAKDYLVNLCNSANVGLLDMIMPGWQDYALSLDRMCTSVWAGTDPKAALETAAAEWDQTTERLGADSQKAFYAEYKKLPGSSADHTVETLGHGREALTAPSGGRASASRGRAAPSIVATRQPHGRRPMPPSGDQLRPRRRRAPCGRRLVANGATATSNGCWSRRRCC